MDRKKYRRGSDGGIGNPLGPSRKFAEVWRKPAPPAHVGAEDNRRSLVNLQPPLINRFAGIDATKYGAWADRLESKGFECVEGLRAPVVEKSEPKTAARIFRRPKK